MKIAISAGGATLDSPFEPRFGRVSGFVLYDSDTGEIRHLDNTGNMNLGQGAGIKTAQTIAEQNVEVIITGKVGPKALRALQKKNIQLVEGSGQTVRQVLGNYGVDLPAPASANSGSVATGPKAPGGGQGKGGGGRGRGPARGGQGKGGGARGRGPASGGRGMGGGRGWNR